MNGKEAHGATMQAVWRSAARMRRSAAFAAVLAVVSWSLAAGPTAAQIRPPDPIDQSRDRSTQPRPALPPPGQPTERLVPESRGRDLGTGKDTVTPPHYERSTPDRLWQGPPPPSYTAPGESPTRVPGR
jgi:hypothetical protein